MFHRNSTYPRLFLASWLLATPLAGQGFHAGLQVGVPITEYFEAGRTGGLHGGAAYSSATRRYVVGGSVAWQSDTGTGLELGVLYHRLGYAGLGTFFDSASGAFLNSKIDVAGNSWDFPLLLKHCFGRAVHPFVAGGGVLRYLGPLRETGVATSGSLVSGTSTTVPIDTGDPSDLRKRLFPGLTAGAGVELGGKGFRIAPEIRYTRWTANISGSGGLLRFSPNSVEFLLGVWF